MLSSPDVWQWFGIALNGLLFSALVWQAAPRFERLRAWWERCETRGLWLASEQREVAQHLYQVEGRVIDLEKRPNPLGSTDLVEGYALLADRLAAVEEVFDHAGGPDGIPGGAG